MVIHAHFAQLNYDLHVFDIVQPYKSDLVHLCEDIRLLTFLYSFCQVELWFECFEYCPYIQMWQYMLYVWCWGKTCGSFDEIPSVTMGSCKSKTLNEY